MSLLDEMFTAEMENRTYTARFNGVKMTEVQARDGRKFEHYIVDVTTDDGADREFDFTEQSFKFVLKDLMKYNNLSGRVTGNQIIQSVLGKDVKVSKYITDVTDELTGATKSYTNYSFNPAFQYRDENPAIEGY